MARAKGKDEDNMVAEVNGAEKGGQGGAVRAVDRSSPSQRGALPAVDMSLFWWAVLSLVQVIVFRIIFAQGLLRRPGPRTAAAVD